MGPPSNEAFGLPTSVSALLAEREARAAKSAIFDKDIYEALANVVRKSDITDGEISFLQSFTDKFVLEFYSPRNSSRMLNPAATPPRSPPAPRKVPASPAPPCLRPDLQGVICLGRCEGRTPPRADS
ncbi:MAG: hypothetical protein SEPTF4163_004209 [Sporothrix epigloea]